ncbi:MAG: hypothetical protein MUC87_20030 [Bacteroidia bacterium]|jgi:hypothetical protein|nr:hypothetical protein [Bacteroidia bacterium]
MKRMLFLLFTATAACSTPAAGPREGEQARLYNDSLLALWHELEQPRAKWAEEIAANSPTAIAKATKTYMAAADTLADILNEYPDYEDDSTLRIALLQLVKATRLAAERSRNTQPVLLTDHTIAAQSGDTILFPDSLLLNDTADPEDALARRYLALTRKTEKDELAAWLNFVQAQQAFAQRHGFVLARRRNDSLWLGE